MKRCILLLLSIAVLLSLSACTLAPKDDQADVSSQSEAYDLAYNMKDYSHFSSIFDEADAEEWESKGSYTILLKGLHTPVYVKMQGMNVKAVSAHGHSVELGADGEIFQDCTPVDIKSTEEAVVVNISRDYEGKTFILCKDQIYRTEPKDGVSTQIFAESDGTLSYYTYWGEYVTSFDQWATAPLDLCESRDHFLYEKGSAELESNEIVLTAKKTVLVSDEYDLDAMFAEAKANGEYAEYETLDALLAANKARGEE